MTGDPATHASAHGPHGSPFHRRGRGFVRRPLTPLGVYIRAKLHRRLFLLLGFSILFTVGTTWAVVTLTSDAGPWSEARTRVRRFAATQFESVWNDAGKRDALAVSIADDLKFPLELRDRSGGLLGAFGGECSNTALVVPLSNAAGGSVRLCWPKRRHDPWMPVVPLALVGLGLWLIAGKFARRLSRPLSELSEVAQSIGEGDLTARASLHCHGFDEVSLVAASVNDMAARIEKQLADQRELLAAVSHELRTPLARMRVLSELVRDAGGDAGRLDELEREIAEIDALVGELLASSRLEFAALSPGAVDAVDAARRALERAGVDAGKLSVSPAGADPMVEADPTLLSRALANLVENARKHGGGLESLRVLLDAEGVSFEAGDGGPGFPEGAEDRVFEPFQPTPDGRTRTGGSLGLGLALVRRIALAHGGEASARNRPGGGAVVSIRLPRTRPVKAPRAARA